MAMPRAKLMDPKPRGRMSSYAFFVQTCREEHKRNHPDETVVFFEFSKKCAERWKIMTELEKRPFHELSNKDKIRYKNEMTMYQGPAAIKPGRRRKQKRDPNAPKRPLSAFFWYCSTERTQVRTEFPTFTVGDTARELGKRWAKVPPEIRAKCEEMSKKDNARYIEEMRLFKNGEF